MVVVGNVYILEEDFKIRNTNNDVSDWQLTIIINCSNIQAHNFPFHIFIMVHVHANKLLILKYFSHMYLGIYILV